VQNSNLLPSFLYEKNWVILGFYRNFYFLTAMNSIREHLCSEYGQSRRSHSLQKIKLKTCRCSSLLFARLQTLIGKSHWRAAHPRAGLELPAHERLRADVGAGVRQVPGARSAGRLLAGEQGAATQVSGGRPPRRQRWARNFYFLH
jgi:hypothetical protein